MKILYIHQYYQNRDHGVVGIAGTRSYEIAKRLSLEGYEVEVLTTNTNCDVLGSSWVTRKDGDVNVHMWEVPYSNKMRYVKRILSFMTFALLSISKARSLKPDLIYATSTPLTVGLPALVLNYLYKIPYVFEVRDLWPEAPKQLGVIKSQLLLGLLYWFEKQCYRRAKSLVALSPGIRDGILATLGKDSKSVFLAPNAADNDLFSPAIRSSVLRERYNIPTTQHIILYFGTFGYANGLDYVLDAAQMLLDKGIDDYVFVLHGDGRQRDNILRRIENSKLTNVFYSKPLENKLDVAMLVASSDICLTTYKDIEILRSCSPNKMFDSMAAGKPIITNVDGWLRWIVEENKCGWYVEGSDPNSLVQLLVDGDLQKKLELYGKNSRLLAETVFNRDIIMVEILKAIRL